MKSLKQLWHKLFFLFVGIFALCGVSFFLTGCSPTQASVKSYVNRIIREIQSDNKNAANSAENVGSAQNFFNNSGSSDFNKYSTYSPYWKGYSVGDVSCWAIFNYQDIGSHIAAYAQAIFYKGDAANGVDFDFLINNDNNNLKVIKINISRGQPGVTLPAPEDGQVWA